MIFVDTSALYALADKHDPVHPRALTFYRECTAEMFTCDFVFAETMSLMTKRLNKGVAVEFGTALRQSPRLRIEETLANTREEGWRIFSSHRDKGYDLIDCISFSLMKFHNVHEAFGFDRHFRQHGFDLFPVLL